LRCARLPFGTTSGVYQRELQGPQHSFLIKQQITVAPVSSCEGAPGQETDALRIPGHPLVTFAQAAQQAAAATALRAGSRVAAVRAEAQAARAEAAGARQQQRGLQEAKEAAEAQLQAAQALVSAQGSCRSDKEIALQNNQHDV
jgi:hypothetical protein